MSKKIFFALFSLLLVGALAGVANADHPWGNYHWARTANPLSLKLGDNMSSSWDSYLAVASSDWSASSVLDTSVVASGKNPRTCRPTAGRVEVCNYRYGNNGWLGIAQIWISGSHITQGVTKMNDTYFNTSTYNTPAWKQFVVCQEVGHTFGLDHQDENFNNANLGSCMDYTSNPGTNQHPNAHDYAQLETIYAHLDSTNTAFSTTVNGKAPVDLDNPTEWGKAVKQDAQGKDSVFEKDLGQGKKLLTHVLWVE